jgi:hypothetical protein
MKWFNIAGLTFDLAGAVIIAIGVIASQDRVVWIWRRSKSGRTG